MQKLLIHMTLEFLLLKELQIKKVSWVVHTMWITQLFYLGRFSHVKQGMKFEKFFDARFIVDVKINMVFQRW